MGRPARRCPARLGCDRVSHHAPGGRRGRQGVTDVVQVSAGGNWSSRWGAPEAARLASRAAFGPGVKFPTATTARPSARLGGRHSGRLDRRDLLFEPAGAVHCPPDMALMCQPSKANAPAECQTPSPSEVTHRSQLRRVLHPTQFGPVTAFSQVLPCLKYSGRASRWACGAGARHRSPPRRRTTFVITSRTGHLVITKARSRRAGAQLLVGSEDFRPSRGRSRQGWTPARCSGAGTSGSPAPEGRSRGCRKQPG